MKNRYFALSAVLLAALSFAPAANAADGAIVRSFLTNLEGHYTGKGTRTRNDANGTSTLSYSVDLQVTSQDENSADLQTHVDGDDGSIYGNNESLVVRGNNVFYRTQGMYSFPARVLDSTPTSLAYSIQFVSGMDGLTYDVTMKYTLQGDALTEHVTTSTNGVVVSDDEFTADKF